MPCDDGTEPVANDEYLLRRISESSGWYNPESDQPIAWEAFRPNKNDVDGLSVWREKYLTPEQAASTGARPERRYYILRLRADRVRKLGVEVKASPEHGKKGHASLETLSAARYKADRDAMRELAFALTQCVESAVEGPYGPFPV